MSRAGHEEVVRQKLIGLLRTLDPSARDVGSMGLIEAAERLEKLVLAHVEEGKEKAAALQAANDALRDLTQDLDHSVRQRTRALAESDAQLKRKNAELDRLNRVRGEFVSIAAHELRTPMVSIVGYLDLIVRGRLGELPADLVRPMSSLHRNAHRLKRLIDDMLDVSRIEAGRIALRRASCDLGEIVLAVVDELKLLAAKKSQKLITDLRGIRPIDGDIDKIHQVVLNLVANSIKYTPDGGEIRISVDEHVEGSSGSRARLRVRDNGIGIPLPLRARIFEPFSDVNSAKHHTSSGPDSAGLGLYIARGIVELHGGTISVDSEEGRYSEFTVTFPVAEET